MVDRENLGRVNQLYDEREQIVQTLNLFDQGGRIIRLTVGVEGETNWQKFIANTASVSTEGLPYPPQMVDAIKGFLEQRKDEIAQELADLGLSGVEAGARAAPHAASQQRASRPPRR